MQKLTRILLFYLFLLFFSCSSHAEKNINKNHGAIRGDGMVKKMNDSATVFPHPINATSKIVDEIAICCKKLSSFSFDVQERNFSVDSLMDSIVEINKRITSLIMLYPREDIGGFIKLLKNNTDIHIIASTNSNLVFYTWEDEPINQTMFSHTTIVDYSTNNKRIIKSFDNKGYLIENVFTIRVDNQEIFLVTSSCTIGSAHVANKMNAYEIIGEKFIPVKKIFKEDEKYYDELKFEYFINAKIDGELNFKFDSTKNLISVPITNANFDSVVGERNYSIRRSRQFATGGYK